MNKQQIKRIKQWIRALKSKKYVQGDQYLFYKDEDDVGKFCCLGVAIQLYCESQKLPLLSETHKRNMSSQYADSAGELPSLKIMNYYGFDTRNPIVSFKNEDGEDSKATLSDLNDTGYTFEQIAKIIEENFIGKK